jgi:ribosome modulation factor
MSDQMAPTDVSTADNQTETAFSTFEQGYRAFLEDVPFECCPYVPGRPSYSEWARGWLEAEGERYGD